MAIDNAYECVQSLFRMKLCVRESRYLNFGLELSIDQRIVTVAHVDIGIRNNILKAGKAFIGLLMIHDQLSLLLNYEFDLLLKIVVAHDTF